MDTIIIVEDPEPNENVTVIDLDNENSRDDVIEICDLDEEKYQLINIDSECNLLSQIIDKCITLDNTKGMLRVINKSLIPVFRDVEENLKNSLIIEKVLTKTYEQLKKDPIHKFSHVKELCETLKHYKLVSSQEIDLPNHKRRANIKEYELNKKRKILETNIIDLDDDCELEAQVSLLHQDIEVAKAATVKISHEDRIHHINSANTEQNEMPDSTQNHNVTIKNNIADTVANTVLDTIAASEVAKGITDTSNGITNSLANSTADAVGNGIIDNEASEITDTVNSIAASLENGIAPVVNEAKIISSDDINVDSFELQNGNAAVENEAVITSRYVIDVDNLELKNGLAAVENGTLKKSCDIIDVDNLSNSENINNNFNKSFISYASNDIFATDELGLLQPTREVIMDTDYSVTARIRQIENGMLTYKQLIDKFEQEEVMNDTSESPYIQCQNMKEKLLELYQELCRLTGRNAVKHRRVSLKAIMPDLTLPTKKLETFINERIKSDGMPHFPDFGEVVDCVLAANQEGQFGWSRSKVMAQARALFTHCGRALQQSRERREWRSMKRLLDCNVDDDPADRDPALEAKLQQNKALAKLREQRIQDMYSNIGCSSAEVGINNNGVIERDKDNNVHLNSTNYRHNYISEETSCALRLHTPLHNDNMSQNNGKNNIYISAVPNYIVINPKPASQFVSPYECQIDHQADSNDFVRKSCNNKNNRNSNGPTNSTNTVYDNSGEETRLIPEIRCEASDINLASTIVGNSEKVNIGNNNSQLDSEIGDMIYDNSREETQLISEISCEHSDITQADPDVYNSKNVEIGNNNNCQLHLEKSYNTLSNNNKERVSKFNKVSTRENSGSTDHTNTIYDNSGEETQLIPEIDCEESDKNQAVPIVHKSKEVIVGNDNNKQLELGRSFNTPSTSVTTSAIVCTQSINIENFTSVISLKPPDLNATESAIANWKLRRLLQLHCRKGSSSNYIEDQNVAIKNNRHLDSDNSSNIRQNIKQLNTDSETPHKSNDTEEGANVKENDICANITDKDKIEIKEERVSDVLQDLEDMDSPFTATIFDIEDPFLTVEISSDSSSDEDEYDDL